MMMMMILILIFHRFLIDFLMDLDWFELYLNLFWNFEIYIFLKIWNFQNFESGVLFFTGVFDFLEATVGFLATWHHVCWKRCGKRMHNDPTQDGFRFFSLPDDEFCGILEILAHHHHHHHHENHQFLIFYGISGPRERHGWIRHAFLARFALNDASWGSCGS